MAGRSVIERIGTRAGRIVAAPGDVVCAVCRNVDRMRRVNGSDRGHDSLSSQPHIQRWIHRVVAGDAQGIAQRTSCLWIELESDGPGLGTHGREGSGARGQVDVAADGRGNANDVEVRVTERL